MKAWKNEVKVWKNEVKVWKNEVKAWNRCGCILKLISIFVTNSFTQATVIHTMSRLFLKLMQFC